ncbi:MAG: hypothetical protein NXI31_08815 [bacterium]|nr:hypothetical protein [bacterium]
MTDKTAEQAAIQAFGRQYDYDVSYLERLLEASRDAYDTFVAGQPMSLFRRALPLEAHFIARVAAMQGEDCGACAQLTVRMAVEAGVDRDLLRTMLAQPEDLPSVLFDVYGHARDVASQRSVDPARAERVRAAFGEAAFAELAVVIAGSRIYPTAKRALLMDGACEILSVDR